MASASSSRKEDASVRRERRRLGSTSVGVRYWGDTYVHGLHRQID